jgi:hypothetical protein
VFAKRTSGNDNVTEFCQSMADAGTYCGGSTTWHGLWARTRDANGTNTWSRVSGDQSTSSDGWTACASARGSLNGIAKCLSRLNDQVGKRNEGSAGGTMYWVSSSFLYIYDSTTSNGKWISANTVNNDPDFHTTGVDNANCSMLCIDPNGNLWAGYYDVGLWKYNPSVDWRNKNGPSADGTSYVDGGTHYENDELWGFAESQNATNQNYGGNVNGMTWTGSTTAFVTEANSSKGSDKTINGVTYSGYNYRLYKSTSSGDRDTWVWQSGCGLPYNNGDKAVWLNSLFRDSTGTNNKLWVVAHIDTGGGSVDFYDRVWSSSDSGGNWSPEGANDLPKGGIFVVRASNDVVMAGGPKGLWRKSGGSWSQVTDIPAPTNSGGTGGEKAGTHVHRHQWNGVQDIYCNPWSPNDWYVVVYSSSGTSGGVYKSTNGGVNFTQFSTTGSGGTTDRTKVRRSVLVDSCGVVHIASGQMFSSSIQDFPGAGKEIAVPNGSGGFNWITEGPEYESGFPDIHTLLHGFQRTGLGAGALGFVTAGQYYWGVAPGQGVFNEISSYCPPPQGGGGCEEPCETEGHTPPGSRAGRPREEGEQPKLPRTMFSIAEARELISSGRLELYDVSGRRTKEPRPGLFFQLERNRLGAVTARRMVLVTR